MIFKTITAFTISLFLVSCSASRQITSQPKDDGIITLKFIQLNDVYEIAPLGGGKYGGMARVAHVVDSIRGVHPNTYLYMAGDFLNPSLLGTIKYKGERIRGKQMIEVMNAMDFDMVTFGNHEFDLDREDLQKRLDESNFSWISSNVKEITESDTLSFKINRDIGEIAVPTSLSREITDLDGTKVRVSFFSVTLDANPREYVHYEDYFSTAANMYRSLSTQSDILVGLTHLKVEDDKKLALALPELDLIMGGHEHNNMIFDVGNAVIAKADANAKTIYIHTITHNTATGKTDIASQLFPIDDSISEDPEVRAIVEKWNLVLNNKIREVIDNPSEVIFHADPPLDGTDSANRGIQTNMGEIITAAMFEAYGNDVDAALVNGGSIRLDDMLDGDVSSIDIFRVLPFGGSIIKVDITGDLLQRVLDFGKDSGGTGAYLQRYNIDESASGGWLINGAQLQADKRYYTVAFSDFLLKGYDIPFLTEDNPGVLKVYTPLKNEIANDIRKAVILYLKSKQ